MSLDDGDAAWIESVARVAVSRLRIPPADRDDIMQEARIVAWQQLGTPIAHAIVIVRRRTIDRWRVATGHRRRHRPTATVGLDALGDHRSIGCVDAPNPIIELGLTGRYAVIAGALAEGHTRRRIAAEIGVDP
ncbi:MAG: hypothetical protein JST64_13410, partial [Actinobacteria bacterium]|nr:hypothetical protein [Actinomycetota bacterium]